MDSSPALRRRAALWLVLAALTVTVRAVFSLLGSWSLTLDPFDFVEPLSPLRACFEIAACLTLAAPSAERVPRRVARASAALRTVALALPLLAVIWPRFHDELERFEGTTGPWLVRTAYAGLVWVVARELGPRLGSRGPLLAALAASLLPYLLWQAIAWVPPGPISAALELVPLGIEVALAVALALALRSAAGPRALGDDPLETIGRALRDYVTASRARMMAAVAVAVVSQFELDGRHAMTLLVVMLLTGPVLVATLVRMRRGIAYGLRAPATLAIVCLVPHGLAHSLAWLVALDGLLRGSMRHSEQDLVIHVFVLTLGTAACVEAAVAVVAVRLARARGLASRHLPLQALVWSAYVFFPLGAGLLVRETSRLEQSLAVGLAVLAIFGAIRAQRAMLEASGLRFKEPAPAPE